MAFASDTTEFLPTRLEAEAMFRAPVGFISPLWAMFGGAALGGVAWWWATQWWRSPATILETVAETAEAVEVLPPMLMAPVVEAVAGPALATAVEAELPADPLGGESAPVPPAALEAAILAEPTPDLAPEPATFAAEPPAALESTPKPKPPAPKAKPSAPSA